MSVRTLGRRASFLGGDRGCRAHSLDKCGTVNDRVLLGVAATAWGLEAAVNLGAIAIAFLSVSAVGLAISIGRTSPRQPIPQTC